MSDAAAVTAPDELEVLAPMNTRVAPGCDVILTSSIVVRHSVPSRQIEQSQL